MTPDMRHAWYAHELHTTLFDTIFPGTMAPAPALYSQATKTSAARKAPTNSPMIVALDQAYSLLEPNWRARRSIMAAGARSANPGRSNFGSVFQTSFHPNFSFFPISGMLSGMVPAATSAP